MNILGVLFGIHYKNVLVTNTKYFSKGVCQKLIEKMKNKFIKALFSLAEKKDYCASKS
jgi:hypothetical protein